MQDLVSLARYPCFKKGESFSQKQEVLMYYLILNLMKKLLLPKTTQSHFDFT